jgi:hypothetical protein
MSIANTLEIATYFKTPLPSQANESIDSALSFFCFIFKDTEIVIDYRVHKVVFKEKTEKIVDFVVDIFDQLKIKQENIIHVNLEKMQMSHIDKYYDFMQDISTKLMQKFPTYELGQCNAYNSSFIFPALKKIVEKIYKDQDIKNKLIFRE